jgi:DNA-binding NarL/FixJ family response regulator
LTWVLVADNEPLFREGLRNLLSRIDPGAEVLEAGDQDEAAGLLASRDRPEMMVCSLVLPGPESQGGLKSYLTKDADLRVIGVMNDCESLDPLDVLRVGASGVVSRTTEGRILQLALSLVKAGGIYVPSRSLKALVIEPEHGQPAASDKTELRLVSDPRVDMTPRQRQVLRCLVKGMSNKLIARELGLELATVKTHVHGVIHKLGVGNRTQAALKAHSLGLEGSRSP